jgi:hypothetical protein
MTSFNVLVGLSNPHMDILSISWKLFLPGPAEWGAVLAEVWTVLVYVKLLSCCLQLVI